MFILEIQNICFSIFRLFNTYVGVQVCVCAHTCVWVSSSMHTFIGQNRNLAIFLCVSLSYPVQSSLMKLNITVLAVPGSYGDVCYDSAPCYQNFHAWIFR